MWAGLSFDRSRAAWAVCVGSFIALLAVILCVRFDSFYFAVLVTSVLIIWLGGMIAAITFSEDGWVVKGSKSEWIAAFLINPLFALMLYLFASSKDPSEGDFIDPSDEKRMSRL